MMCLCGPSRAQEAVPGGGDEVSDEVSDGVRSMTLEELEAYVGEQKAALDSVIESREVTESKARELEARLAERESKIAQTRHELETLCEEREAIDPGTLADCLAALPD